MTSRRDTHIRQPFPIKIPVIGFMFGSEFVWRKMDKSAAGSNGIQHGIFILFLYIIIYMYIIYAYYERHSIRIKHQHLFKLNYYPSLKYSRHMWLKTVYNYQSHLWTTNLEPIQTFYRTSDCVFTSDRMNGTLTY